MNDNQDKSVIILGQGGHAQVLSRLLNRMKLTVRGYLAEQEANNTQASTPWLGNDNVLNDISNTAVDLVNGIGSVGLINKRAAVFIHACSLGFRFRDIIDPTANIDLESNQYSSGIQILTGVIINGNCIFGENVLLNTGVIIEHDTVIGAHSHIACGAVVSGNCNIGKKVHIGVNATINQGITIGDGAVIASGAVVIQNVPPNTLVAGVPATHKRSF